MAKKGTMQYYRDVEAFNLKLKSRLLARTKRKSKETAKEWLQRIIAKYDKRKKESLAVLGGW